MCEQFMSRASIDFNNRCRDEREETDVLCKINTSKEIGMLIC